jgi:methylglyoxal reductase
VPSMRRLDAGINLIDTAPIYGFGRSEQIVGKAIRDRRDRVVLATKCSMVCNPTVGYFKFRSDAAGPNPNGHIIIHIYAGPESVRQEVESSLLRLQVDHIDLLQTHWQDTTTPIAETMECLLDLKSQGKIRAIGACNATADQLGQYCQVGPFDTDQEKFSLVNRDIEQDQLPFCRENNVAVLAYSPLGRGLLTGKIGPDRQFTPGDQRAVDPMFSVENRKRVADMIARWQPLCENHNVTPAQLITAWTACAAGADARSLWHPHRSNRQRRMLRPVISNCLPTNSRSSTTPMSSILLHKQRDSATRDRGTGMIQKCKFGRRQFIQSISALAVTSPWMSQFAMAVQESDGPIKDILVEALDDGRNREEAWAWFHPRACMIPGSDGPVALMAMQRISGSDYFWPVQWCESTDLGKTWSDPSPIPGLGRHDTDIPGLAEGVCDVSPDYHAATNTTLFMGHNVYYRGGHLARPQGPRWPVYTVRDADGNWSEAKKLVWDDPRGSQIYTSNCGQRNHARFGRYPVAALVWQR